MNTTVQLTMQWKAGRFSKGIQRLALVPDRALVYSVETKNGCNLPTPLPYA